MNATSEDSDGTAVSEGGSAPAETQGDLFGFDGDFPEDFASISFWNVLAEKLSVLPKLGQPVWIVGSDGTKPFIHKTYVNELRKSGRIGVVNAKTGKGYLEFEEAYLAYVATAEGLVDATKRRFEQAIATRSRIPSIGLLRAEIEAASDGTKDNSAFSVMMAPDAVDYSKAVGEAVPQPKFFPGTEVFALLLPDTHSMLSSVRTEPYRIVTVTIEEVSFNSKGELRYRNDSSFHIGESEMFATQEEALEARERSIRARMDSLASLLGGPVEIGRSKTTAEDVGEFLEYRRE